MLRKFFFCFVSKMVALGVFPFLCMACVVYAQTGQDSVVYQFYPLRIDSDFSINAKLTNPVWERARAIFINHSYRPNDEDPAQVNTMVKMLYSDDYIYVAFWAEDPHPPKIRAHITDRDKIENDDQVGVIFDPFNNNQSAFEFYVNPKGIQLDAKRSGQHKNLNFDMLWYSKGAVNDSGYTAVIKVPLRSLHFPDKPVQAWSANFIRKYPRDSHYEFSWTDLALGNGCILCQNGNIPGMTGMENSTPIDIIPYALGFHNSSLNNPADPASGLDGQPVDGRIGVTITYAPTSTSSLDATINPDFSQIETDATEISVNKTFAIQYDEKRPFFLKRAYLFQTGSNGGGPGRGSNLFYSRTINQPWAAGKFTQTGRRYSIGILTAYDRNTIFVVPGLLESSTVKLDLNSFDNILRGRVNFGSQSHVGGLLTTRNEASAHNYMGSIDWKFYLGNHFYFNGNAAYSNTKELTDSTLFNNPRIFGKSRYDATFNGQQFGGTFLNAEFQRETKYYDFSFSYSSFSPTFRAQNGFVTRIDRRRFGGSQELDLYFDKKWFTKTGIHVSGSWRYTFSNIFMERFMSVSWYGDFIGQTQLSINYFPLNDERFRGTFFTHVNRVRLELSSQPVDAFSFRLNLEKGRFIYRKLIPVVGHGYNISAGTTIKPFSRLKLSLHYNYSTLSSLDDQTGFYSGSISRLEAHYSFTRHFFFRLIGQYDSFNEHIQIYPLLYYKLNPFTKIYLGMTDYMVHVDRFGPPKINGYRQINREFFVKVQYLFRK